MNLAGLAKIIMGVGISLLLAGFLMLVITRISPQGMHVPGDIYIKRENFSFYFPLGACIIISLILTLVFSLLGRR